MNSERMMFFVMSACVILVLAVAGMVLNSARPKSADEEPMPSATYRLDARDRAAIDRLTRAINDLNDRAPNRFREQIGTGTPTGSAAEVGAADGDK